MKTWEKAWWAAECLKAPDGVHQVDDNGRCEYCEAHCGHYHRAAPTDHDPRSIDEDPDEDDGRQTWWPGYVITHDEESR